MPPHLIYAPFLSISFVWDYVPLNFKCAGYVAALRPLDAIASNEACRSCGSESTRSPSEARSQMGAIDRISEHRTPRINREFGASWGDTWTHRDAPIKIGRMRGKIERGPASWDRGSSYAHDLGHPTDVHQIEGSTLFARNFLIKTEVFSSSK